LFGLTDGDPGLFCRRLSGAYHLDRNVRAVRQFGEHHFLQRRRRDLSWGIYRGELDSLPEVLFDAITPPTGLDGKQFVGEEVVELGGVHGRSSPDMRGK